MRSVFHFVGSLDVGGVEVWLLNLASAWKRRLGHGGDVRQILVVFGSRVGSLENRFIDLGFEVWHVEKHVKGLCFFAWRVVNEITGDVIFHSSLTNGSFIVGLVSKILSARTVTHVHNLTSGYVRSGGFLRKLGFKISALLEDALSDIVLGCCAEVLLDRYGVLVSSNYYSLPYGLYQNELSNLDRIQTRNDSSPICICVVGRLCEQKNQKFAIEIAARLRARSVEAKLRIFGAGPLLSDLVEIAKFSSLDVEFMGARSDILSMLKSECDVFLMPSLFEGLPVSVREAQILGIPCLVSDAIPPSAILNRFNSRRLSLTRSCEEWCDSLINLVDKGRIHGTVRDLKLIGHWSIESNLDFILSLYESN